MLILGVVISTLASGVQASSTTAQELTYRAPTQGPGPSYEPTPTPAPRTMQDIICSYPWDCQTAIRIATCESTLNPRAYNDANYGIFQINAVHGYRAEQLYDPEFNVRVAYELYQAQGWAPWACL